MGAFGIWHWLVVLVVVLVLFGGGGRISRIMGDMGKGLKAFRQGLGQDKEKESSSPTISLDDDKKDKSSAD